MSVRQRVAVGGLVSVAVVGGSLGLFLAQGPDHSVTEIHLEDTAEIIYEPDLREGIEEVRFHEPTEVAVFTHGGGAAALTDDLALNDAVLAHARETRPDWLSEDEQRWADDLYIFAVDPEGRLVGTYFGDDREVSQSAQGDIQEAAGDSLSQGQWTEGAVIGVQEAASRMNAPLMRSPGGLIAGALASLATLVGAGVYVGVGAHRARRSRQARADGDRGMANVIRDQEETQLHAHLIPEDSRYGGQMLQRYDEYTQGVRELTELGNQAKGIPERDYDRASTLTTLTAYQAKAAELDTLDDVIADTAAFLNRDRRWSEAWDRQVAPLRDDLSQADDLIGSTLPTTMRDLPEAQAVRDFSARTLVELDELRADLEHERIQPDDALDRLRDRRNELTSLLDSLAAVAAREYSEEESERDLINESMRSQRSSHHREPTIISTVNPAWTWFTIASFRSGYTQGESQVEQARSAASSGGSSSGYSSGGSFSGAGSSSRF